MRRTLLLAALASRAAYAQDPFEIQVYDVETARAGDPGLEVHVNQHVLEGEPDETHVTFEPHYGLTAWAEIGGYFQTALTTTGDFAYAGVKLRLKVRRPCRSWHDRIGFAINAEVSAVPSRFEPNVWGSEIRPIADLLAGRWYAAVNPILAIDLRGDLAGHPQLEPAAKLAFRPREGLALGGEAYGAFGPLDHLGSEHVLSAYAVVDLAGSWWDLDAGAGYAWDTNDHAVVKLIFGVHPRY